MENRYLLLIEDNVDDVYLTLRTLKRHSFGLPVRVIMDSEDALSFLDSAQQMPLAVLVSYRLPRLTGLELIERLRGQRHTRNIPALLLTGSADERDRICGVSCTTDASACLVKPLASEDLTRALSRLDLLAPVAAVADHRRPRIS